MTPVWWLLIFFPALLALYFLKLKRRETVVSSTYLWKRSLEDLRVNAPFQRLRRSLLFLLQLLVLLALVAALWQPRWGATGGGGRNLLVLFDTSASMNAREAGGARLERARAEALSLIRSMEKGDRMAILTFASRARTLQTLTSDTDLLASRVRSIRPTSLPTDLGSALAVAASLADTLGAVEIHVLGDGCYGDLTDLPPEVKRLNLRFVTTAHAVDGNLAIVEASVRRSYGREKRTEVFVLVANDGRVNASTTVSLHHEGILVDAREVALPAGETRPVVFAASHLAPGMLRASLDVDDPLADDDEAFLEIAAPRTIPVLFVGEGNEWIELALGASADFEVHRLSPAAYASGVVPDAGGDRTAPVVVFDRRAPAAGPRFPSLYIGCHPPLAEGSTPPRQVERPLIIDWDRSHPVNRFLAYTDVHIERSLVFDTAAGWRGLVEADAGALVVVVHHSSESGESVPAVIVGFDVLASDWPLAHLSFPLFMTNAVRWLARGRDEAGQGVRTGEALVHRRAGATEVGAEYRVTTPDGEAFTAQIEAGGDVVFAGTEQRGVYEFQRDGKTVRRFPVSLLSLAESSLRPSDTVDLGDFTLEASAGGALERRDLWWWFALAGLAFLFVEWYVYHRRVYV